MKKLLVNSKKLSFIVLAFSLFSSSLFASTMAPPAPNSNAPKVGASTSSDNGKTPNSPNGDCKCKCPFKRFASAVEALEKDKTLSSEDTKKIMNALMQIPRESLNRVEDKDQAVADMLYKDKILTEAQYKKISELLKASNKQH